MENTNTDFCITVDDVISALRAAVNQGVVTLETPVELYLEKLGRKVPLEQFSFYSTSGKVDLIGDMEEK